jgi:hypothetical protein
MQSSVAAHEKGRDYCRRSLPRPRIHGYRGYAQVGVSFVFRIRNKLHIESVEELPLAEADRAAGVIWQAMVKVEVDGKELLLATDLEIEAELIALIYRYRWQT